MDLLLKGANHQQVLINDLRGFLDFDIVETLINITSNQTKLTTMVNKHSLQINVERIPHLKKSVKNPKY